ncbi:MAG: PASTA domain-containing protein [Ignavibacteria bacterium]|nr:PASTA domain-containing protein [Ignavibacteria bacterium]
MESLKKILSFCASFRAKVGFISLVFLLIFSVILYKLVNVQIINSAKYKIAARKQYEEKIKITPSRGLIYDRNMNVLVSNSLQYSFAVDPTMVTKPDSIANMFARIFKKDKSEYLGKITNKNTSFVYLERKADVANIQGLDSADFDGLIILKEPKRVYNYGRLASQVLGYTNMEGAGLSGIEQSMETELAGKDGFVIMQRDGKGQYKPNMDIPKKEPVNGNNIVLTLDINIQKFAEEELERGVKETSSLSGKVIVTNVKTGEILGMASYPSYDPNNILISDTAGFMNRTISDVYEPGSTFKVVAASAALEEKLMDKMSLINTENGHYSLANDVTMEDEHKAATMTFQQALEQSSNIGFMKISQKIGPERFYKYARDFGFGISTGIELPGENKGILKRPIDFSPISLPYMAIGYEVLINAMQLTSAYSTVANNGVLLKPYIIKKETGLDGQTIFENSPIEIRQVISQNTAKLLSTLMIGVVETGTATDAQIGGVKIAGKTGTAQRVVDGKHSSGSHTGSFVGFFPADNPQFLITVILDDPKGGQFYGGKIAAPVFKRVAERIIGFSGNLNLNEPKFESKTNGSDVINVSNNSIVIPNLQNLKIQDAKDILREVKLTYEIIYPENFNQGDFLVVESQQPEPNTKVDINSKTTVKLVVKNKNTDVKNVLLVPDVKGYSLRKAINVLSASGFDIDINGSGEVIDQMPKSGSSQLPNSKITLFCKQIN